MFADGVATSVIQAQLLCLSWNAWRYPAYNLPPTLPTQVIGVLMRRCLHTITRRRPRLLTECCGHSNVLEFWRSIIYHFDVTSGDSFSVTVRSMEVTHSLHKLWFMLGALAQPSVNPLKAELNPICHLLLLLGDLTFMGPCVVSISNKMQRYTVYLYLETALRVSGDTSTHHQERIQLYLQHLVFVTSLLLSDAIVEELETVWVAYATHSTLKPVPTLPR
jgi:hypothetical protein